MDATLPELPVPEELLNEFRQFVREVPVGRLSKNLRNMLLLFMTSELDALPWDFKEFLEDLQALFYLLDEAEGLVTNSSFP